MSDQAAGPEAVQAASAADIASAEAGLSRAWMWAGKPSVGGTGRTTGTGTSQNWSQNWSAADGTNWSQAQGLQRVYEYRVVDAESSLR